MADALLDINVLVALAWPQHVHHGVAHGWLRGHTGDFFTTPLTESALLRLSLNERVTQTAVTAPQALRLLAAIRAHSRHRFLTDASSLAEPAIQLNRLASIAQVADLHLVNLAAQSRTVLVTLDRGLPEMLDPDDRRHVVVLRPAG